jgi:hypothetical protein
VYGYATVFGCAHIVARVGYCWPMDEIIKYVLDEMRVLGNAPVVFAGTVLIIAGAIWWALSWRYSGIIKNRERTIALYKNRLGGASPDEAKAKLDSLEGQIWTLKDRVWPKLPPTAVADLENSLKTIEAPQQIAILPQDIDSVFLARDLVDAFTRIGWPAKQDSSVNGIPDGLSVWPDNELGRAVRDALDKATGGPVTIREDKYAREHGNIAIGIGYKVA